MSPEAIAICMCFTTTEFETPANGITELLVHVSVYVLRGKLPVT